MFEAFSTGLDCSLRLHAFAVHRAPGPMCKLCFLCAETCCLPWFSSGQYAGRMNENPLMPDPTIALVAGIALSLFFFIVMLWILWAIIRGAVLSALRKHSYEVAEEARRSAHNRA